MQGSEENKKQGFVFPKKDELIDQIKCMDDDFENVALNLVKCDFAAVQKDVEKTFSDFTFVKIKKYNPGSFEVIFQTRIDAINFIRNCFDKKILARRFFIKMGRQQRQHVENWSAVGYVPKSFKQPPKKFYNRNKPKEEGEEVHEQTENKEEREERRGHHKGQHHHHKKQHHEQAPKVEKQSEVPKKPQEPKAETKVEVKEQSEPQKPVEHKVIPKIDYKSNKKDGQKKREKKGEQKEAPKEEPKVEEKVEQTKEEKEEDDGWIVVPAKKAKGKK